jgi:hypothetical protein
MEVLFGWDREKLEDCGGIFLGGPACRLVWCFIIAMTFETTVFLPPFFKGESGGDFI